VTTETPLLAAGRTLGVIGVGVMGRTLIRGLLHRRMVAADQVWGSSRSAATCEEAADDLGVAVARDYPAGLAHAGIILVCVKPAQVPAVLTRLKETGVPEDTLLISIAAGVGSAALEEGLGSRHPWVRAMPNTPCVVGEGMTAVSAGRHASADHLARAQRVFSAVGRCVTVDEGYLNAITALSGSGPAYMYLVLEALADAGVRVGLPRDLALTLVSQSMLGAARKVQETGRHPAALRDDVTTPAGCTIGGLMMLEDGKIRSVLARAVEEATRIAGQLGNTTDKRGAS
jgi:pyrroline-5-carboxylate reductase